MRAALVLVVVCAFEVGEDTFPLPLEVFEAPAQPQDIANLMQGFCENIRLDEELVRGNSSRSDTFGNEPLTSTHEFEVSCVELWTFE